jgi:RNase P protein component
MSTTTVEGRGTSKPTTAEEQNERRRAAKARQRKNRKLTGHTKGDSGFRTGLYIDRHQRKEAAQRNRIAHAKAAREIAINDETLRSPARELIVSTLEAWADVSPSKGCSRTYAALETALDTLEQKPSDGVVRFVRYYVGQALNKAYETKEAAELRDESFPAFYTVAD